MDPYSLNLQQQNQQLPIVINSSTPHYQTLNPNINLLSDTNNNDILLQSPNNVTNPVSETNELLQNRLRRFWKSQQVENEQPNELKNKNHSLPLARIKKIMKSDGEVRMISAEAPVLLSKACDMFIQDLTLRSWVSTEECKRRTLQKGDISAALSTTDLFDFLVDIVPREKPILFSPPSLPVAMPSLVDMARNIEYPRQHDEKQEQQLDGYTMGEGSTYETSKIMQEGKFSCLPHQSIWPTLPDL